MGVGRAWAAAATTRAQAEALRTSGPTPVSIISDRSTPLVCLSAAWPLVHVASDNLGDPVIGENASGTAQARSTTRVAGTSSGPRKPRKSGFPLAVISPPPNGVKLTTAYPASSSRDASSPRWSQKVMEEQSPGPPPGQSAP